MARAAAPPGGTSRGRRIIVAVVYWVAVLIVALAVAVGVVAYLISRDQASLDSRRPGPPPAASQSTP